MRRGLLTEDVLQWQIGNNLLESLGPPATSLWCCTGEVINARPAEKVKSTSAICLVCRTSQSVIGRNRQTLKSIISKLRSFWFGFTSYIYKRSTIVIVYSVSVELHITVTTAGQVVVTIKCVCTEDFLWELIRSRNNENWRSLSSTKTWIFGSSRLNSRQGSELNMTIRLICLANCLAR